MPERGSSIPASSAAPSASQRPAGPAAGFSFSGLQGRARFWLRVLTGAALPFLLYAVFFHWQLTDAAEKEWMDAHVRSQGLTGIALYVGLTALLTGCGVPRQILSFLAGYVFGALNGAVLATLGTILGCGLTFFWARCVGRRFLERRLQRRAERMNDFLRAAPFRLVMAVRILPLGSNFLTNILAGVSRMPALPFLGGSLAGFLAQNAIFSLLGSGMALSENTRLAAGGLLYLCSLSIGYWLYRHFRAVRKRERAQRPPLRAGQ